MNIGFYTIEEIVHDQLITSGKHKIFLNVVVLEKPFPWPTNHFCSQVGLNTVIVNFHLRWLCCHYPRAIQVVICHGAIGHIGTQIWNPFLWLYTWHNWRMGSRCIISLILMRAIRTTQPFSHWVPWTRWNFWWWHWFWQWTPPFLAQQIRLRAFRNVVARGSRIHVVRCSWWASLVEQKVSYESIDRVSLCLNNILHRQCSAKRWSFELKFWQLNEPE